ncbi:MAG: hypothetical protein IPM98_03330 [Lewinellaceae bacterium]|nr:hypothetical protein [Lewinellaceae bacterium]
MQQPRLSIQALAFAGVLLFFALIWLYTREFKIFTNTIGVRNLALGAMLAGAIVAAAVLYALRNRLTPWENHLPETLTIAVFCVLFAPLFGSLLNRAGGVTEYQPFVFVSEMPYLAAGYGLIKGEKIKPSGIRLTVKEHDRTYRFQYQKQVYFPLTKPGETVLLPVRKGLLGLRVVELK